MLQQVRNSQPSKSPSVSIPFLIAPTTKSTQPTYSTKKKIRTLPTPTHLRSTKKCLLSLLYQAYPPLLTGHSNRTSTSASVSPTQLLLPTTVQGSTILLLSKWALGPMEVFPTSPISQARCTSTSRVILPAPP